MGIGMDRFGEAVAYSVLEAPMVPVVDRHGNVSPFTGYEASERVLDNLTLPERLGLLNELITESWPVPTDLGENLADATSFEHALNLMLQDVAIELIYERHPDAAERLHEHLRAFEQFDE